MANARGLPIAAYLGMLVALALASAFVAVIAIVIWLPPRPPDVMRTDVIAAHFEAGYRHMQDAGRPRYGDDMRWRVQAEAPPQSELARLQATQVELAVRLDLHPDQVRANASRIERSDVFVFRVREGEARVQVLDDGDLRVDHRVDSPPDADVDADEDVRPGGRRVIRLNENGEVESEFVTPAPPASVARTPSVAPVPPVPPVPPAPRTAIFAPAPPGVMLLSGFEVGAQLPDGRWLVMSQGRNWEEIGWIARAALVIGGTLTVLSLLAVLFARRLTRPIRNFSNAVQAVGVDPQNAPVEEEGPRELRGAARAVNTMQARLRALIADRTKTLAAVAHDMRTPLMRLRLAAENAPPEQRERMAKEIAEVEALVASFIAFARDDPAEEARVRLDLAALLQSIADDHAEHGRNVSYAGEERLIVTAQSLGLKRLFSNLVENALKYGASARIALRREGGSVIVDVEDDGPGVPAERREAVFEPFVRLNGETGGAGLGLPAARSIARAHGGDIAILDGERGALLRVTLPG